MIKAFRTDAHPPGERTEYWVEAVRQAATRFEIRPRDDTALCGSLWAASVGEIHVGHVDAGPQRMARTRTIISDESDAPLLLSLREASSSVVAQGGRETLLTSGYLAVFDARRPFLRDFPGRFRQNVAAVPFQLLDVPGSYLAALIGQVYPPTHYIGGILSSFVSRLAAAAESGTACPARNSTCSGGLTDVLIALAAHKGAAAQGPSRRLPRRPSGCLSGTTPQHTCTGGTSPRPRSPRLTACPCAICTSCSKTRTCPSAGGSTTSGWKPAARIWRVPPRPARRWERSRGDGASSAPRTSAGAFVPPTAYPLASGTARPATDPLSVRDRSPRRHAAGSRARRVLAAAVLPPPTDPGP